MKQILITFWLLICSGQAAALECPDYYRFVDLGFDDSAGTLNAGGPRVRAEGFDGTGLLNWDTMTCFDLPFTSRDGFGNTIPVVEQVFFNPAVLPVAVLSLEVRRQPDMTARAEDLAAPHRAQVAAPQANVIRGEAFLCVQWDTGADFSCQFPSLDRENLPLVVVCGGGVCTVPLLAVGAGLELAATWPAPDDLLTDPQSAAPRLSEKVRDIKAFIETLL